MSSEADNAHALGEPRAGEPAFKLFEITGFDKDLPHDRSRRVQKFVPRGSGFFCAMGTQAGVPQISITLGSDAVFGRVPVAEFVEVARVDDVPPSTVTVVHAGAVELALVNVDGTFYAVGNECPHRGGFLGEGEINSDWHQWALECPLHASVFDVRTGEVLNPPAREAVRTYDVSVDQGIVRVAVD